MKELKKQLKKGIEVEKEHTKGSKFERLKGNKHRRGMQKDIAEDHIEEDPRYYDHLSEMEKRAKRKLKK